MFFFNLGEYTAEVTFPITLSSNFKGQNDVFGPLNLSHLISRPTCNLFTPLVLIFFSASLPIKSISPCKLTKRSKPNSKGFVYISASA